MSHGVLAARRFAYAASPPALDIRAWCDKELGTVVTGTEEEAAWPPIISPFFVTHQQCVGLWRRLEVEVGPGGRSAMRLQR